MPDGEGHGPEPPFVGGASDAETDPTHDAPPPTERRTDAPTPAGTEPDADLHHTDDPLAPPVHEPGSGLRHVPRPTEVVPTRRRWRFIVGSLFAALVAVVLGSLWLPPVRAWAFDALLVPIIADALGRDDLVLHGRGVNASYPVWLPLVGLVVAVGAVLSGWATLTTRRDLQGAWASRIRIDPPFLLATLPYLVLGVIWVTLESAQLFRFPWVFLFVSPVVFFTVAGLLLFLLTAALWIESEGPGLPRRFVGFTIGLAVLRWLMVHLGGFSAVQLPWWGYVVPVLVGYVIYFGITLGNRLVTHRRILFALGLEQCVFFGMFLWLWVANGPWPDLEWIWEGNTAIRAFTPADPAHLYVTFIPVIGFVFGMYTIGSFLHHYVGWARPWANGLNLALFFGQMIEAWILTIGVNDPFGVDAPPWPRPAGVVGWLLDTLGGWGYLLAKLIFVLLLVHFVDVVQRDALRHRTEQRALLKGVVMALGLLPGLRAMFRIVLGI